MAEKAPQTYANHVRLDPLFHYGMLPVSFVLLVWSIVHLFRHYSHEAVAWLVASLLISLAILQTRTYALKVQDRIIRLEERLRLANLAPSAPIASLSERQLVALRFACDTELPSLAEKAAASNMTSKQIKQAVQNWRADYFRI